MATAASAITILVIITAVHAQRPFYAGGRPIGYPAVQTGLSNRFGEDEDVPILTKGDRDYINRIESLPIDYRPFWYINYRQYQNQYNQPQTWPIRPNNFIDQSSG